MNTSKTWLLVAAEFLDGVVSGLVVVWDDGQHHGGTHSIVLFRRRLHSEFDRVQIGLHSVVLKVDAEWKTQRFFSRVPDAVIIPSRRRT